MSKRWYVVHAYSGYEKKVKNALEERIQLHGLQELFGEVLVPSEEVVEMKGGQKRRSERKFFPGYVLVEMELNDDSWHMVKDTPRVMGFIGEDPKNPGKVAPITKREADTILQRMEEGTHNETWSLTREQIEQLMAQLRPWAEENFDDLAAEEDVKWEFMLYPIAGVGA